MAGPAWRVFWACFRRWRLSHCLPSGYEPCSLSCRPIALSRAGRMCLGIPCLEAVPQPCAKSRGTDCFDGSELATNIISGPAAAELAATHIVLHGSRNGSTCNGLNRSSALLVGDVASTKQLPCPNIVFRFSGHAPCFTRQLSLSGHALWAVAAICTGTAAAAVQRPQNFWRLSASGLSCHCTDCGFSCHCGTHCCFKHGSLLPLLSANTASAGFGGNATSTSFMASAALIAALTAALNAIPSSSATISALNPTTTTGAVKGP
mmetsp:Transcript_13664/g.26413  ORF Transcript_13664/g.26413 Transcript_13664/m.26413 type:complete len:263 (-) Transcript_13664:2701-3489(-)